AASATAQPAAKLRRRDAVVPARYARSSRHPIATPVQVAISRGSRFQRPSQVAGTGGGPQYGARRSSGAIAHGGARRVPPLDAAVDALVWRRAQASRRRSRDSGSSGSPARGGAGAPAALPSSSPSKAPAGARRV